MQYIETNSYPENLLIDDLFFRYLGEDINIFIQDKNIDWKVSKLSGLILLDIIETLPKESQNKIITEIINYASSELDESSVYIKLS